MKYLKNNHFFFSNTVYQFTNNGIVKVKSNGQDPDFSKVEKDMKKLQSRLNGNSHMFLFDNLGFSYAGKKARLQTMEVLKESCAALAIVAKNKVSYGLACVFVSLSNLEFPIRVFEREQDAEMWLCSLMNCNEYDDSNFVNYDMIQAAS